MSTCLDDAGLSASALGTASFVALAAFSRSQAESVDVAATAA
ncbi:hypothetical protein [Gemmatimonas sp.]